MIIVERRLRKMNQQQRDEILINLSKQYDVLNQGQQGLKKEMQETKKEMQEIKKEMWSAQKIIQRKLEIEEEARKLMQRQQEEMKHTQRTMQEELTRLGNIVTRMEYEHGRKLDMILEVLTGHEAKLQEHEKRFEKDEKIIELHGHQIYGIEQKMQA